MKNYAIIGAVVCILAVLWVANNAVATYGKCNRYMRLDNGMYLDQWNGKVHHGAVEFSKDYDKTQQASGN